MVVPFIENLFNVHFLAKDVYYISELPSDLPDMVERVRTLTDLPVGVGFGVSRPEQAAWLAQYEASFDGSPA